MACSKDRRGGVANILTGPTEKCLFSGIGCHMFAALLGAGGPTGCWALKLKNYQGESGFVRCLQQCPLVPLSSHQHIHERADICDAF